MRNGSVCILRNGCKHESAEIGAFDSCSSAPCFDGVREDAPAPPTGVPKPVAKPRTWLACAGWRPLGLIGPDEAPAVDTERRTRGAGRPIGPRRGQNRARVHC
jgi:hypothetical protein